MYMKMKKILSLVLSFAMVLSLIPVVNAVDLTGLTVIGLTATYGEAKRVDLDTGVLTEQSTNGSVTWSANGAAIEARANAAYPQTAGATLTLTNNSGADATLTFNYEVTGGTVRFNGEPVYAGDLYDPVTLSGFRTYELGVGQSVTIELLSVIYAYDDGFDEYLWYDQDSELTLSNISLATGGDKTVTFQPAENGSYTVDGQALTDEKSYTAASGTEYALVADANEGYQFFGWYNATTGNYVSYSASVTLVGAGDWTIYPVFVSSENAIFAVGSIKFQDLDEANAYATNGVVKTIVLLNNGTLTGEHTISAGNTLLIPYDDANSVHTEATPTATQNETGNLWTNQAWEKPTAYRTLTMAQGAKLTIEGALNVGGRHSAGPFLTAGAPSGNVGMIQMVEGSNITVANGGSLYCWGYIYGGGTVTAKDGATVHENIQFADFRGGNATAGIAMTFLVFPMTQYYVQNIEVAATFESGATENVWGSIFIGSNNQCYGTSVEFIGSDPETAMFVPGENGSVTKTYIPETDRLRMDVDGDGSINPMTLTMDAITTVLGGPLNTETFVLPITNNMTINVNSGTTSLNQSLALLPGVELNIVKDAVLKVNTGEVYKDEDGNPVLYTAGHNLIVYDREQWLNGWIQGEDGIEPIETYYVYNGKRLQPVAYSVTGNYVRTEANLVDAVVDINGTLITDGFIYTTVNIEPDEDPENELGIKFVGSTPIISSGKTGRIVMNNGAGQDMMTMQATQDGTDPIFVNLFMVSARLENADGTYLETMGAEAGATFNYCDKCNAWFVGEECTNVHSVEITWIVNGLDSTSECDYGEVPSYPGETPKKAADATSRYVFIGWSTSENGEVLETLPDATEDAVYYACFTQCMIGDVDLDGDVDSDDMTLLARHVAKIAEITDEIALVNADTDGDGDIDSDDMTLQARYVAKIISSWNS